MDTQTKRPPWYKQAETWSRANPAPCLCGGAGYYRVAFPVGHNLFGKAIPCACQWDMQAQRDAEKLRSKSGLTPYQWGACTMEAFDPNAAKAAQGVAAATVHERMAQAVKAVKEYAARPQGWLLLQGGVGSGKTHLAAAVVRQQVNAGNDAHFVSVMEALDRMRAAFGQHTEDDYARFLRTVNLLVLDDLGAERSTEWAQEALFGIIDHRYGARYPLIVTTNCAPEQLDKRIASRLQQTGWGRTVVLPCGDFRISQRRAR